MTTSFDTSINASPVKTKEMPTMMLVKKTARNPQANADPKEMKVFSRLIA